MPVCPEPGCPVLTEGGRCPRHSRALEQRRGSASERGYNHPWAEYSKRFRAEHPLCGERADGSFDAVHSRCVQQGLETPAQCVDHIVPMSQGGEKWNPSNHMSACLPCNTWKQATIERSSRVTSRR